MNKFNPGKLLNSKWTAQQPTRREKHFLVTEIELDEAGGVVACTIEAVLSGRSMPIAWQDLREARRWAQGWK